MTGKEITDEEMSLFFKQQEEEAAKVLADRALIETVTVEIITALDQADAHRMYDPDPDVAIRNMNIALSDAMHEVEDEEAMRDVESLIKSRVYRELNVVETLIILLMARNNLADEATGAPDVRKKEAHAVIELNGFDEGWVEALDQLLDGPLLDIKNNRTDYKTYQSIEELLNHPENDSVMQVLISIFPGYYREALISEDESRAIGMLEDLLCLIAFKPNRRPDAESHIAWMEAMQFIEPEDSEKLLSLLDNL